MSKNQEGKCPCCGCRISFRQFVLLNNFSAINCNSCNARIEISNRNGNAVIAGLSGMASAISIVYLTYAGDQLFRSTLLGFLAGSLIAGLLVLLICKLLYKRSQLTQNTHSIPLRYRQEESVTNVA